MFTTVNLIKSNFVLSCKSKTFHQCALASIIMHVILCIGTSYMQQDILSGKCNKIFCLLPPLSFGAILKGNYSLSHKHSFL